MIEHIPEGDRILLQSVARLVLSDAEGTLAEQLGRRRPPESRIPLLQATRAAAAPPAQSAGPERPPRLPEHRGEQNQNLLLHNGIGGYSPDGPEYNIRTEEHRVGK